jgi:DNA mismatch repair protein MutS
MTFYSLLYLKNKHYPTEETIEASPFVIDLNLNQIIDAVAAGKDEYNLKPFYYAPLNDSETIQYRQEVAQDIEDETLLENIKSFAQKMVVMRRYLNMLDKLHYMYNREGWFLEAVDIYCKAIIYLEQILSSANLKSRGLLAIREYLKNYAASPQFIQLLEETEKLKNDLSSVKYCVIIKESTVKVRKYELEADYSIEIENTFNKFKQGEVKDYTVKMPATTGMNHIEAQILNFVAKLYPDIFLNLDNYCIKNRNFLDETISTFDREIQFYVAYLDHIANFKRINLKFCYPQISAQSKEIFNYDGFDLALANKCLSENSIIICNDFYLKGKERIFIVSGPNQGGKTTFARTFGQLHYISSLGLPVPGRKAKLFLFDKLFTHFEQEEDIKNLRGKLQDDMIRIHDILDQATSNSIIIMNEIFTSTTLKDAVFLSKKILERINQLDSLCVCVTFIDELASLSEKTVSMVSTVVPENPAQRTYKIIRKPADGLAFAISIAEKYHLTYELIKDRIKS